MALFPLFVTGQEVLPRWLLIFFRGKQSRGTARIHGDQRSLCPPLNLLHWERLDDRPRQCSFGFFHISRTAAASPHVPPSCALEAVIDIRVYGERTIFHLAVHRRLGCIISTYCTSSCLVRHAALELLRFTTQKVLLTSPLPFSQFNNLQLLTDLLQFFSYTALSFPPLHPLPNLPFVHLHLACSLSPLSTLLCQHFDSRVAGGGGCRPRWEQSIFHISTWKETQRAVKIQIG